MTKFIPLLIVFIDLIDEINKIVTIHKIYNYIQIIQFTGKKNFNFP